jgi:hypothetical protein
VSFSSVLCVYKSIPCLRPAVRRIYLVPRSVDLAGGLSSPLLCAPARRPAHLLGCSASPRLVACLAACVGALLDSLSLCTPSACAFGAGVPTRGTSHWGHPLQVERYCLPWRGTRGRGVGGFRLGEGGCTIFVFVPSSRALQPFSLGFPSKGEDVTPTSCSLPGGTDMKRVAAARTTGCCRSPCQTPPLSTPAAVRSRANGEARNLRRATTEYPSATVAKRVANPTS